ncbi:MAG: glutaredoxin family protein [Chromatiaceae bacterium]|nr:glutaredoxin family protein [Chromatiaceae bacterium]MCF8016140.1 glutaredoxin family protein [Chromatiaceae bacterium]
MGRGRTGAGQPRAPRVLLYSSQGCAHCRQAKAFLEARGIAYSELDVGRSAKARKALERLGARAVPTILVGDQRLDGFSERAFLAAYKRHSDS